VRAARKALVVLVIPYVVGDVQVHGDRCTVDVNSRRY